MTCKSEFTVQDLFRYDQRSAIRWIFSHVWRYKGFAVARIFLYITSYLATTTSLVLIGRAAEEIINPTHPTALALLAGQILGALVLDGCALLLGSYAVEIIAKRVEADARQELYASLLGKSQTFHHRQRVGDIMARATDDISHVSAMIMPCMSLMFESVLAIGVPLCYIAAISPQMLLVPGLFVVAHTWGVRHYTARLNPVTRRQRAQFGQLNAGLGETISGIEVVKASAREAFERQKFDSNARRYRDLFVQQGEIEARYLPLLLFGIALGLTFWQAILLYRQGILALANIIAIMGLMNVLRFPAFSSIYTFALVQVGLASAERVLSILREEAALDENRAGYDQPMRGEITFEHVTFGYDEHRPLLKDVSFHINPGQSVAIVGQTGSGKTALTQLVNRTYEASSGRVLIDGVDVRDWNLTALRSQISKIEQDIFLFSRTLAENIAFGAPDASQAAIEQAAQEAQAHRFIIQLAEGYQTVVGERGVTLSGGQRQRIALARAFLSNPCILILDDSTSAIDSATEDEIQKAIQRAEQGRTTLLITHRLSQIRWADMILVLDQGQLVAAGTHEDLLHRSPHYRRIFARYDLPLPTLAPTWERVPR